MHHPPAPSDPDPAEAFDFMIGELESMLLPTRSLGVVALLQLATFLDPDDPLLEGCHRICSRQPVAAAARSAAQRLGVSGPGDRLRGPCPTPLPADLPAAGMAVPPSAKHRAAAAAPGSGRHRGGLAAPADRTGRRAVDVLPSQALHERHQGQQAQDGEPRADQQEIHPDDGLRRYR
jgi:hypothetical protein